MRKLYFLLQSSSSSAMERFVQIALLLILAVATQGRPNKVPWWQVKVAKSQGPNACVVEEIPELGKKYWTECKFWPVRKICGRDTIIRYDCCEGYRQVPGEEGCTGVKPLRNVLDTARELGATKFVKYLEDSGIGEELKQEGTFTIFAPLDSAFEGQSGTAISTKIQSFMRSSINPVLRYHICNKKLASKDFSGNVEMESQYEGRKLRINKYSNGMETVNCALISRKDQEASNGVVHIIDNALDPTQFIPLDVAQIVEKDERFSIMAGAMNRCNFLPRLKEIGKSYTLLAPSDEAFLKIPPARLEKMLADRPSCTTLLENHVVPHVMCTPVITEEHKARTIGSQRVAFDCDDKGHMVESKRLGGEIILGENGAVYMLDDVLIPDRARTVLELAETKHLYGFSQLVRVAGLEESLSNAGNYTIFAPSEEALITLDEELMDEAKKNPDLARKILLYHFCEGRIRTSEIRHNQIVQSLDEENGLRLLVYRKKYGVEDALIEQSDFEGYNGILHVVNKVLFPAPESAGDMLRKSGNYSIFLSTMENVLERDPEALDLRKGSAYTFFVPTDEAFRAAGSSRIRRIQTDTSYASTFIKNHVGTSMAASESFKPDLVYDILTRQKDAVITCTKDGRMKVNDASVVRKDIVNANGIIHVIDRLLLPDA